MPGVRSLASERHVSGGGQPAGGGLRRGQHPGASGFRLSGRAGRLASERFVQAEALVRRTGWPQSAPFSSGYFGAVAERLGLDATAGEALATTAQAAHCRRPSGVWNQVDPEAEAVLMALPASGLRLGVVSNADGRVEEQLQGFGLRSHLRWS